MKKYGVLLKKVDFMEIEANDDDEARWKALLEMHSKGLFPEWVIDQIKEINSQ